jgi:CDP-2,3-bis-(O-geranylgeranyl)-sn-glycerol synthase
MSFGMERANAMVSESFRIAGVVARVLHVLQLIYLMLPAYLANMAPPFTRFWPGWNRPISRRWLGDHKTVVGFCAGLVVALVVTFVQSKVSWGGGLLPYAEWPLIGLALGFGAMAGDSLKSLLKRLDGIPPGRRWIPMDQLDFVAGSLLLITPFAALTWLDIAIILVVSFIGDIAVNHLSYALGIRITKW